MWYVGRFPMSNEFIFVCHICFPKSCWYWCLCVQFSPSSFTAGGWLHWLHLMVSTQKSTHKQLSEINNIKIHKLQLLMHRQGCGLFQMILCSIRESFTKMLPPPSGEWVMLVLHYVLPLSITHSLSHLPQLPGQTSIKLTFHFLFASKTERFIISASISLHLFLQTSFFGNKNYFLHYITQMHNSARLVR